MLLFGPELARSGDGFRSSDFSRLSDLEGGSFWFRSRNRLIAWALHRYFPDARSLLEVGSGTGFVLAALEREFPAWRLVGGELFLEGLSSASRRVERATLFQMDARHIPFQEEFDVVAAFDVLEHIEEDDRVLAEVHRALTARGGLLLTVPQHPFLWSGADDYADHKRRYRRADLVNKVKAAGFDLLRCTAFVALLMPLLIASRVWQRSREEFDPDAELELPKIVDLGLERLLDLERWLIRGGVSFPFGGSLLLVGRKAP